MSKKIDNSILVHFKIQAEKTVDGKKTVQKLKTIRPEQTQRAYSFPEELQELKENHPELLTINKVARVCKSTG